MTEGLTKSRGNMVQILRETILAFSLESVPYITSLQSTKVAPPIPYHHLPYHRCVNIFELELPSLQDIHR
jgi:hypothetical protein